LHQQRLTIYPKRDLMLLLSSGNDIEKNNHPTSTNDYRAFLITKNIYRLVDHYHETSITHRQ